MEISKIEKKGNTTRFMVKGVDEEFINALRRTIESEIATLAIEEITIYENNSNMADEFLAHRLALIPIKTDLKMYKTGEKLSFSLEKKDEGMVYSKDLKSNDPKIEVIDKKIPIVKLKKGQKIKLEAKAIMQNTKNHSRHKPAIIGYKHLPEITFDEKGDYPKNFEQACPVSIIEQKAKKFVIKSPWECTLCGKCRDVGGDEFVTIDTSKKNFILTIETIGQLSLNELISEAIKIIQEKATEMEKELA